MLYGFGGSCLIMAVALAFKPESEYVSPRAVDSLCSHFEWIGCGSRAFLSQRQSGGADGLANLISLRSITTWALEEARRRLEAEGILEDPDKKKAP